MSHILTDEEVEREIEKLASNPDVQLARAAIRVKYKRRQYLYSLRNLAKRGADLRAAGYSLEDLRGTADRIDDQISDGTEP